MSKRFRFECVEQFVFNPDYKGYRNFRIEVFDERRKDGYNSGEIHILVPAEFFDTLYNALDGKESDLPLGIGTEGSAMVREFVEERRQS